MRSYAFLFCLLASLPSYAKDYDLCLPAWTNDVTVAAGWGAVSGLNLQLGYRPKIRTGYWKNFGIRLDGNWMSGFTPPFIFWNGEFNVNIKGEHVHFDLTRDKVKMHHKSLGVLLDYFPDENGYRVTGGLYVQKSFVDSKKAAWETDAYAAMEWKTRPAPYIGVGYDYTFWKNFGLVSDFGVMYVGAPDTELDVTGIPGVTPEDIEPVNQKFKHVVRWGQLYPIVRVSLSWKF